MSKLHIPGPGSQATACGRQLNNHRLERAQVTDKAELATSIEQYMTALHEQKACRFCGRAAGLIPPVRRIVLVETENEDTEQ